MYTHKHTQKKTLVKNIRKLYYYQFRYLKLERVVVVAVVELWRYKHLIT
jgi:hypothetical protein